MKKLGQLDKKALREIWGSEIDFSDWLAEPDNLKMLGDEIGIDLIFVEREASVGDFSVDLLVEEENTGDSVIVENQLESTDHDHLGKVITYGSGLDAKNLIWIVENARDEHVRAIDWINENTDPDFNFFLVEMEIWQINDSALAPKFNIVSKPNDWFKRTKEQELTDAKKLQLKFWTKFKEYASDHDTRLSLRKPRPQHWYSLAVGNAEAHMSLTVNTRENELGCELYIKESDELFEELHEQKSKIEEEMGEDLDWQPLPGKKASRIKVANHVEVDAEENWKEYFEWLLGQAEKMHEVFGKRI